MFFCVKNSNIMLNILKENHKKDTTSIKYESNSHIRDWQQYLKSKILKTIIHTYKSSLLYSVQLFYSNSI